MASGLKARITPDPRAEEVRWAICEAQLVQAIGRGRGVNRTDANPLLIDILTNVVLPIEIDEVTTWGRIQPRTAHVMRSAGAVPLSYTDMATAYPALFPSRDAAKKTIKREAENWGQTPIAGSGEPAGSSRSDKSLIWRRRCGGRGSRGKPGGRTREYGGAEADPSSPRFAWTRRAFRR